MADEKVTINGVTMSVKDMKKFWREKPDPGFSEARNKSIINEVIQSNDIARRNLQKAAVEGIRERTSAVADFLSYKHRGGGNDIVQYLGRKNLAELRGQQIIQALRRGHDGQKYLELKERQNAQAK